MKSLALALLLSCATAGAAETLTLGTATPGGGFAVYGQALADALRDTDSGITLELRATKGSRENIALLAGGKLDLALVEGTIVQEVLGAGVPAFSVIATMYSSAGMFVVRADSPYRSIADLKGKRVAFGAFGSGLTVLARHVLEGLGLDMENDFDAVLLESVKDGPPMVLNGEAAALWGGGLGWPGFEAVARGPVGARFIGPEQEDIAAILAARPFLRKLVVPAGSYRGQAEDITTVGAWSYILARPGLPQETAHRLARALHRAQPALGQRLVQARETTPENALAALPQSGLLHPGVVRYFKEIGLLP